MACTSNQRPALLYQLLGWLADYNFLPRIDEEGGRFQTDAGDKEAKEQEGTVTSQCGSDTVWRPATAYGEDLARASWILRGSWVDLIDILVSCFLILL